VIVPPRARDASTITGNSIPHPMVTMILKRDRANPAALKASVLKRPSMMLSVTPINTLPT